MHTIQILESYKLILDRDAGVGWWKQDTNGVESIVYAQRCESAMRGSWRNEGGERERERGGERCREQKPTEIGILSACNELSSGRVPGEDGLYK